MAFHPTKFGFPRPFHSRAMLQHGTDRRTYGQTNTAAHFIMPPFLRGRRHNKVTSIRLWVFGRVSRIDPNRLHSSTYRLGCVHCQRRREQPKNRWFDTINIDCQNIRLHLTVTQRRIRIVE